MRRLGSSEDGHSWLTEPGQAEAMETACQVVAVQQGMSQVSGSGSGSGSEDMTVLEVRRKDSREQSCWLGRQRRDSGVPGSKGQPRSRWEAWELQQAC